VLSPSFTSSEETDSDTEESWPRLNEDIKDTDQYVVESKNQIDEDNKPWICDCSTGSYPITCQRLTEYYTIDYIIKNGDEPGVLFLEGTAKVVDGKRHNVSRLDRRNRFTLFLFKNGILIDQISLLRQGDRSLINLKGKIDNKGFDAVTVGYRIWVYQ
jgi:hypothetical protein